MRGFGCSGCGDGDKEVDNRLKKIRQILIICLVLGIPCKADTFVNRHTGERFNGYAVQRKKQNKTQVYVESKKPQYFDLNDYEVYYNYHGRKNKVFIITINKPIELICETEAFEKSIQVAANQGPLFILIEIDTPGGRGDLMKRLCAAITKIDNCMTVAFISGGQRSRLRRRQDENDEKYGGAFSAGAFISLACHKIFMADGTAIGAAAPVVGKSKKDLDDVLGETMAAKIISADLAYIAALAEKNGRPPLLAKAMVDNNVEVVEVLRNDQRFFIEPESKRSEDIEVESWSDKDSLLTLTALEALRCGVADGVVDSEEELFSLFQATRAARVQDKEIATARSYYVAYKIKFDRATAFLDSSKTYVVNSPRENARVRRMLAKKYMRALVIAKQHPDLKHHVEFLERGLNRYKD